MPAPMLVKFLSLEDIERLSNQEETRISGSIAPKPWLAKQCNPWWIDPHKDGPAVQTAKLCDLLQKIEEDLCALCRQLIADSLTKQKSELADRELFANWFINWSRRPNENGRSVFYHNSMGHFMIPELPCSLCRLFADILRSERVLCI
jgi:hypothetical protein